MRYLLFLCGTLFAGAASAEPYFSSSLWPEEGKPTFRAKADLSPLSKPESSARSVEGLLIKKGELLTFTDTSFQTISPGRVVLEEDLSLEGALVYGRSKHLSSEDYYDAGKPAKGKIKKGEAILVLQYRAEGTWLFESNGSLLAAECAACQAAQPQTAWWVKTERKGKTGWLLVTDETLESLPRSF